MSHCHISDALYLGIKQYLNNGIPNVHLSKGCIGELCVYEENDGKCMVIINLWQSEFNDFLGLRNEFKRLGASRIYITQTLDDDSDFICNGINQEDGTRTITVEFTIEQHESIEDKKIRTKAYRDFWDMAYRVGRTEQLRAKHGFEVGCLYLVKYILKAMRTSVNKNAVDLGDAIKMVEHAINVSRPEIKIPTLSELRRLGFDADLNFIDEDDDCPF